MNNKAFKCKYILKLVMKQKIIAFEFDGIFIRSEARNAANKRWLKVMADLLKDPAILKGDYEKNKFSKFFRIMQKYLKLDPKDAKERAILTKAVNGLYQILLLSEVTKLKEKLTIKETLDLAKKLKFAYKLALITATPEWALNLILKKLKIDKLFNYIYKVPTEKEPNKDEVIKKFVSDHGKPCCLVGKELRTLEICEKLEIPFILYNINKYEKEVYLKAKYQASDAEELRRAIKKIKS